MLEECNLKDSNAELYYNGIADPDLNSFDIHTPYGRYTPDFLLLRREGGRPYDKSKEQQARIARVFIIETKGKPFYDDNFKMKEKFIKKTFKNHNPHIHYISFVDEDNSCDFDVHIDSLQRALSRWLEEPL